MRVEIFYDPLRFISSSLDFVEFIFCFTLGVRPGLADQCLIFFNLIVWSIRGRELGGRIERLMRMGAHLIFN